MRHLSALTSALLASLLFACGQPAVESVEEIPISVAPEDLPSNALAIVGTVVDYETGAPIPNALIQTSPSSHLVLTTDRGEFVLQEGLFPGELYRVSARADGYTSSEITTHLTSERHHLEIPLIDEDRSLPLLFEPTTAVFTPSVHRIASSVRSRSNEPVSWELTSIPAWLQASSAEGSLQPFGLDWFELTLSDNLPTGQTDPLYGTLEFRDHRDRIALLQVIAVPAPPDLVTLSLISAEIEVLAGTTTVLRAQVGFGDSPLAGALAHLTIDGPPDGLIPTHSSLRSGADGEITAILVADSPGTYDLTLSLAAYPDSGTVEHSIEVREPPTPGLPPLPDVIDLQGPSSPTNQTSATFTFACDAPDPCTFSCQLTGASQGVVAGPVDCASPQSHQDLTDDEYTFLVRVITDEQQGPIHLYGFTVDTTPPEILDLQGPDEVTSHPTATLTYACSEPGCSFTCSLYGAEHGALFEALSCADVVTLPMLADDTYTFEVYATDPAGNIGAPQAHQWTLETDDETPVVDPPPAVIDLQGPPFVTADDWATFTFACDSDDPCSFGCELHGASQGEVSAAQSCDSGVAYTDLDDDEYLFVVWVVDNGSTGPASSYSFIVSTTPPEILNLQGPDALTNQATAFFSYDCDQPSCDFLCTLQGAQAGTIFDQALCAQTATYPFLPDDDYTFTVVATDPAGVPGSPQHWSWTVDTVVPVLEDPVGPDPITHETSATFSFDCSKPPCSFTCELYGASQGLVAPASECSSGISFDDLDDDEYTFTVYSTDEAGNQSSPLEWHWEVNNSSPVIGFVSAPTPYTMDDWAFFEFDCVNKDTCTFECALDTVPEDSPPQLGDYAPCDDTWYLSDLAIGTHTLRVRATDDLDQQGEADYSWVSVPPGWATVASRYVHSCGITNDRQLYCWGAGGNGRLGLGDNSPRYEPTAVTDTHDWLYVDTGGQHTCAIRDDHSLWCWGTGLNGRLGLGDVTNHWTPQQVGEESWESVSAGGSHTCGIQIGGGLYCWGNHISGRLGLGDTGSQPTPQRVGEAEWMTVVAGSNFTCGIQTDQSLWCWGFGSNGQLGQGSQTGYNTPQEVIVPPPGFGLANQSPWIDVVTGTSFTCALRHDGAIFCFGSGGQGQMGIGSASTFNLNPVLLTFDFVFDWTSLVAGATHICATRESGPMHCWGAGRHGQTGHGEDGVNPTLPHPIGPDLTYEHLTAGEEHTCGIDADDQLWCWGYNDHGQLGLGVAGDPFSFPFPLDFHEPIDQVSAGGSSACLIDHAGALHCWGLNSFGQLGVGDQDRRPAPQRVGTDHWLSVATSLGEHTCAVRNDSSLWCWGRGNNGRLGLGSLSHAFTPQQVDPGQEYLQVATGSLHTCAITTDQDLHCWGSNTNDQLGTGGGDTQVPLQIGEASWSQVAAGSAHSCGIRTNGTLWCWGSGSHGRLGTGDLDSREVPTQISAETHWTQVALGATHSCALTSGGALYCWGQGVFGRLGVGDLENHLTPQQVGAPDWVEVSAGSTHTCARKDDDTLWCWGQGTGGRLGNGLTSNWSSPQLVGTPGWQAVAAGSDFTVAFREEFPTGMSWGRNAEGQLGDGRALSRIPVPVGVP